MKVVVGETVSVELLDAAAGSVVTLPALLVSDGEKVLTGEDAAKATVTAEVIGREKADKVIVFQFRKRKGSKKLRGHRQGLTVLKVTDIAVAGAKKAPAKAETAVVEEKAEKVAAAKPAVKKAESAAKPAAKPAAAKKPAAKAEAKPAAAKKPAAKPAAKKTTKPADAAE